MTAGTAIRILAGGLAGAVVFILGSMLPNLVMGYDWLLVASLSGGITGLIIGYLLSKAEERKDDLGKQLDMCNADLSKSIQDCQLLTEQHERAKEAFFQTQALHEQVLNTMSSGVLSVGNNGEILFVNKPAVALLGLEDDFTLESLHDVLPSSDIWRSGPKFRDRAVARVTRGDGKSRVFEFSTSPLEDGSFVVVFQDITVAVESQERKQRSEELALVGEMVSRLSHEVRNPLASILMGVKTLQRGAPESSQQSHILQLVTEEVNSLLKIVNQLLESARPRTSSPSPVYVEPLLERCMDAHGFQAVRRGIRLEIVRFPVPTIILVDDQSMLRALGSLIQNALDACSRGDIIRIGWRELDQAGKADLVPGFSGKIASLFVEDGGAGLPDELSSNESSIFKAFVSTKVSGSGLGLTVAQAIVEEHGGVVLVSSLPEGGTRVEILLPIPGTLPCWDCSSEKCVDCASCNVKSTGTGYYCWRQKHGTYHAVTRQWPECCLKCGFFRGSSLTPFLKSRLVVSKVE
jgi:signal transduction histidine kinase